MLDPRATNKLIGVALSMAAHLLIVPSVAFSKTLHVPADKPTIQAAIGVAEDGDVVSVASGTYFENIDFLGKAIKVKGKDGPGTTFIDGSAQGSVVTFALGEGRASVLTGFTIRNGRSGFDTAGFGDGGGIRIDNSSPTIRNNIIKRNRACSGAGISISFGSPRVQGNLIAGNAQEGCSGGIGGGGIGVRGAAAAKILGNIIANNHMGSANGGGISLFAAGAPTIRGNVIRGNTATGLSPCSSGGGISMFNESDAEIVQNVIDGNSAGCGGGVYWLVPASARGPNLVNNTIANNFSPEGSGVFADGYDMDSRLTNNLIIASGDGAALFCGDFGNNAPPMIGFNDVFSRDRAAYGGICTDLTDSNGNISADPMFVSSATRNYHIRNRSPAIDAGDNVAPALPAADFDGARRIQDGDLDGTVIVDMGAYEVTPSAATANHWLRRNAQAELVDEFGGVPLVSRSGVSTERISETDLGGRITLSIFDDAGHRVARMDSNAMKHKVSTRHRSDSSATPQ